MALLTISAEDMPSPYSDSPKRTFYQGYNSGATDGVLQILSTVSATDKFNITKIMISVYDPTSGSTVQLKSNGTEIFKISGSTISSHVLDLTPGMLVDAADTYSAEIVVSGNTVGASSYVLGYY